MSVTYNLTTDVGRVRLLIPDTDITAALFTDAEIAAFLDLEGGTIRLAAAQALDTLASSETMILKVVRTLDVSTDGAKVGAELRARAKELRRQHEDGVGDPEGMFDIAEWVVDDFSRREFLTGRR